MLRILVSGASGFMGKSLIGNLLEKNNDIMLIGRNLDFINSNNLKKKILDLNNFDYDHQELIDFNPEVFIHLAWEGIPNYTEEFSKKNYINTLKIIKTLVNSTNCSKIISTGSCWEYNDGMIEGECSENLMINPQKPFSIYKNKICKEVSIIAKEKKITFNWLRLFYVYGYGQKKSSIIPMLIETFKNKKTLNMNYPANINDFISVDDVSKIIKIFIKEDIPSGVYNAGSGMGTEIKKLLEIIDFEINGTDTLSKEYLSKMDLNKRNQNFYACTKKLKRYIKSLEFLDINSGIKNLIKRY